MSPDTYRQANIAADDRAIRLDLARSIRPSLSRIARALMLAHVSALWAFGFIDRGTRTALIDLLGLHFGRARQ